MKDGHQVCAVVLSGGGANGAYEVGILKALLNGKSPATGCTPLTPDIFAGTSIGSFNASFLVAQWDTYGSAAIGNLEATWLETLAQQPSGCGNGVYRFRGDPFDLLQPACYFPNPIQPLTRLARDGAFLAWDGLQRAVHFFSSTNDEAVRQRLVELLNFTSFVATDPWRRTIESSIQFERIRSSKRKLRIAATNWTTGQLRVFKNLDMTDSLGPLSIMASSAIPGVFPEVYVGAEPHVDGGVLMNTPLKLATDEQADVLHVVYLDPDVRSIPVDALQSTVGTLYRQQAISWAKTINNDIEDAGLINLGLKALDRIESGEELAEPEMKALARTLEKAAVRLRRFMRYRPLTIHRYHPRDDLSGGVLGPLNLERAHLAGLIERGFADAVQHDCVEAQCIIPPVATVEKAMGEEQMATILRPGGGLAPG